jgi:hypothetical protein
MGGVDVGIQEGDRDRLDPAGDELVEGSADLVVIERRHHLAGGAHPSGDTARVPQLHEQPRLRHAHPAVQRSGRPGPSEMQDLL